MHLIGDALLAEGFIDPVLEVEDITYTYQNQAQLQAESGEIGLVVRDISSHNNLFYIMFEVIYGHAFCPALKGFAPDDEGVVKIPVSQIRKY